MPSPARLAIHNRPVQNHVLNADRSRRVRDRREDPACLDYPNRSLVIADVLPLSSPARRAPSCQWRIRASTSSAKTFEGVAGGYLVFSEGHLVFSICRWRIAPIMFVRSVGKSAAINPSVSMVCASVVRRSRQRLLVKANHHAVQVVAEFFVG